MLQYENVAKRGIRQLAIDEQTIDDILDYISNAATHHDIFFVWRPFLPDPGDDLILDLAVTARCTHIVTYNLKHFRTVEKAFGIKPITPLQFLKVIGVAT
jgi:hypothetical protein